MAKRSKAKKVALDILYDLATRGAILLAVATAFLSMYPPSPLAPLYHNPDPKAQANLVLYFAITMAVSALIYFAIVLVIYRSLKRGITRRDLATGHEFEDKDIQQAKAAPASRDRKKAITIPQEQFDKEVAWLFESIYPVKARVDTTGKGKINITLHNDKQALVGVAQASQDADDKWVRPEALKSLNSYKTKANLSRAFFVTTGKFTDDTLEQAKMMGITLVDGQLLDSWRRKVKAKSANPQAIR